MAGLLYTKDELPAVVKLSLGTIEKLIRAGEFPAPRKMSEKRVAWLESELRAWAEALPVSDLPPPPNTGAKKQRSSKASLLPSSAI